MHLRYYYGLSVIIFLQGHLMGIIIYRFDLFLVYRDWEIFFELNKIFEAQDGDKYNWNETRLTNLISTFFICIFFELNGAFSINNVLPVDLFFWSLNTQLWVVVFVVIN